MMKSKKHLNPKIYETHQRPHWFPRNRIELLNGILAKRQPQAFTQDEWDYETSRRYQSTAAQAPAGTTD